MDPAILIADEAPGVRRVTIDRPQKRNALTRPMMQALGDAFAEADADPAVRAIRLDTSGPVFCAGADLDGLAGDPLTEQEDPGHRYLKVLAAAKTPLVATVQGAAVGIGTTMLLHFDLIYAAPNASLRTAFVDLGLTPEAGASFLMPARMGRVQASRLLLLGETLPAAEGLAAGLISQIVPAENLAAHAAEAAVSLAAKPPGALALTKQMIAGQAGLLKAMDDEQDIFRQRMLSDEFRAAVEAQRQRVGRK